jgi:hypothetical protein
MTEKASDSDVPEVLKPPAPGYVPYDIVPRPAVYPLRGRLLCWLFWKFPLNPFMWVLRLFFRKRNPYRNYVAVHVWDPQDQTGGTPDEQATAE